MAIVWQRECKKKPLEIHSDVSKLDKTSFTFSPYMCCVRRWAVEGGGLRFSFLVTQPPPKKPCLFLKLYLKRSAAFVWPSATEKRFKGRSPRSNPLQSTYCRTVCSTALSCLPSLSCPDVNSGGQLWSKSTDSTAFILPTSNTRNTLLYKEKNNRTLWINISDRFHHFYQLKLKFLQWIVIGSDTNSKMLI